MKTETLIVLAALVALVVFIKRRDARDSFQGERVPPRPDQSFDRPPPRPPAQNPSFLDRLLGVGTSFAVSECVRSGRARVDCERIAAVTAGTAGNVGDLL